jgi:hypothetical protein
MEMLVEERPMDLETHVDVVNNNTESNWVA